MTECQTLLKRAHLEELSNGKFRLHETGDKSVPVCKIEFSNRKAARNWGRSRGIVVADKLPDGSSDSGLN